MLNGDFFSELRKPTAFEIAATLIILLVAGFFLQELTINRPDDVFVRTYSFGFLFTFILFIGAAITALSDNLDKKLFLRFLGVGNFNEKIMGVPVPVVAALAGMLIIVLAQFTPALSLFTFQEKTFSTAVEGTDFNRVVVGSVLLEDSLDFVLIPTIAMLFTQFGFIAGFLPLLFLSFFWLPFNQFLVIVVIAGMLMLMSRARDIGFKPNFTVSLLLAILVVSVFFGYLHGLRSGFEFSYMFEAAKFRAVSAIGSFAFGSIAFSYALHAANNGFAWIGEYVGETTSILEPLLPALAIVGLMGAFWFINARVLKGRY